MRRTFIASTPTEKQWLGAQFTATCRCCGDIIAFGGWSSKRRRTFGGEQIVVNQVLLESCHDNEWLTGKAASDREDV